MIAVAHIEPLRPHIEALVARIEDQRTRVQTVTVRTRKTLSVPADVLFAYDSARIRAAARPALEEVAKQAGDACPQIIGFTDDRGTPAYNLALSRRRAEAVRDALDTRCASVDGRGEQEPAASNETAGGRARNRRVEVRLKR